MKILVFSDSHGALRCMRRYIEAVKPDHVIHLGDHFDDGSAMAETYPWIRFHLVPGNCDRYRCESWQPEVLCYAVGGVMLFMTHGHKHFVKSDLSRLIADGQLHGADAVLFGHTHQAYCSCETDGMWVLNPGSCGGDGGSAALIEIAEEKISACSILKQADLERLESV